VPVVCGAANDLFPSCDSVAMSSTLALVSHTLCPYVQRAAIVLLEKGLAFNRIDIDLANKPDWFLAISPLGKTPVLRVNDEAIFESTAICEFLDETQPPPLHPSDAMQRALHRGWMAFGSSILDAIAALYNAPNEALLKTRAQEIQTKFRHVEQTLGTGPYFSGHEFSLVDAVYGPVFRYFDALDGICDIDFFDRTPKVLVWRAALRERVSVVNSAHADYARLLCAFLKGRGSALSIRMNARA
jgi:glutathione S-transferase